MSIKSLIVRGQPLAFGLSGTTIHPTGAGVSRGHSQDRILPAIRKDRQTATNRSPGAIRLKSPGSLVTIACPALWAQTATCASTMSAVAVLASSRPTAVAFGPSSAMRSVAACRMSRERRTCLEGLRIACASTVAGIVIRKPRSIARDECDHPAIVPVERDQPASVESNAAHAAFLFRELLFRPWGERSASAHARSFPVSGPPVCCSASCSISFHPAASKRATPTACFKTPETLAAAPAATSARISST